MVGHYSNKENERNCVQENSITTSSDLEQEIIKKLKVHFMFFVIQILFFHFCVSIKCVNMLISVFLFTRFRSLILFNNKGKSSLE
jgi:hypothetical protein